MDKNAYSTVEQTAHRNAQMGIKMGKQWGNHTDQGSGKYRKQRTGPQGGSREGKSGDRWKDTSRQTGYQGYRAGADQKSGVRKSYEGGQGGGRSQTGYADLSTNQQRQEDSQEAEGFTIEGRNAVIEAFRAGRTIDKLYILEDCQDGPIMTIKREAKKQDTLVKYVTRERLDQISEHGKHQGVIAVSAAYAYAQVEDMLRAAREKGEPPFLILLDNMEDPHNLGAIIRTANLAGAHGVIIPRNRAVGLTSTVARTSAGALNYTPVAKVTNLAKTIEDLKKEGLWFVCADMGGTSMYKLDLKGPIGLVVGSEGEGVGRLVKEKCDMVAAIPMKGNIDSLNASVAAGVLAYEIVRQRG